MMWLFPGFLVATTLIGLPLLLHFLRGKPREVIPFPTLRFLGPSAIRETRSHRLRRWLTLLLRCALILLLAAAFSRPFWTQPPATNGRAVIVVVDNSFSIAAGDRWTKLKFWAAGQIDQLNAGDRAAVLEMNPSPHWIVPLTPDIARVRDTIAAMKPGWQITHYDAPLRLAAESLAQSGAKEQAIVWVADEQRLGWSGVDFRRPLSPGVKLILPPAVAPVTQQAAMTRLQIGATDRKFSIEAGVRLYEPATAKRTVVVRAGAKELARQEVELRVGEEAKVLLSIPKDPSQNEIALTATLEPADDLPADDAAYAVCQGDSGSTILLAPDPAGDGAADFLAHAIDSMGVIADQPYHRASLPDAAWPVRSVVMLRGESPFEGEQGKRLDQFLADGGTAWIWVEGTPSQRAWLERHQVKLGTFELGSGPHRFQDFDVESPLLADFAQNGLLPLLRVETEKAWWLESPGLESLANWENKRPAMGVMTIGRGRMVFCGFAPTRGASNWPGQASFVPFLHQVLTALTAVGPATPVLRVGQPIALSAPSGQWLCVAGPDAGMELKVEKGAVTPAAPGLYEFRNGPTVWRFAVNVDSQESDLTAWPNPADFALLQTRANESPAVAKVGQVEALQGERQNTWWWLVAAALILLPIELAIANRTSL